MSQTNTERPKWVTYAAFSILAIATAWGMYFDPVAMGRTALFVIAGLL